MPASRSARAMIFAPRSWPSRPGLATTTRILFWLADADMAGGAGADGRRDPSGAHDDGVAVSAAGTDGGAAEAAAAAAQLMHQGGEDARAGRPDRGTQRAGAAVDVDAVLVDPEHPDRLQRDRGERLVDLPQVDL